MNNTVERGDSLTGGLVFSAVVVVYVILSFLFAMIVAATGLDENSDIYIYISYLVSPVAIAISVPLALRFRRVPLSAVLPVRMPRSRFTVKYIVAAVLLAFGLLFTLSWLNVGFAELLKLSGYGGSRSYFPDLAGWKVLPALIVMAVLPALFEESLFRGAVLQNIRRDAGELNSVFLCGMCFALFHASPEQTIYQFVCGCAFALLALRSRSLIPCFIVHFLNNAVIITMQACGLDTSGTLFDMLPVWAAVLVTALSAVSLAAGAYIIMRGEKGEKLAAPANGGVKNFFIAALIGIGVLAILWISSFFA